MKSIYITSVEQFSGKTATCLALGRHFRNMGYQVGYLKPVSVQPYRFGDHVVDEDAVFVKETLNLTSEPWELSPVVITSEYLRQHISQTGEKNLMEQVVSAYQTSQGKSDIMLLEGGATLREGYSIGLPTPAVAQALDSHVIVIIRYHDQTRLLDDIFASKARLGSALLGILINRASKEAIEFIEGTVRPYLERIGVPLFGVLPEVTGLAAITVNELVDALQAEVLTRYYKPGALVETFTIGAMTPEAALSRFRKHPHKAVVTGGDRSDIQLAALETSTTCLILTGNLRPSPLVVRQAEDFGVSILLVHTNTMETIEQIENVYGKNRLGQEEKLKQFEGLMQAHFDYSRLASSLQLETVK